MPQFPEYRRLLAASMVVICCLTAKADFTSLSYEVVATTNLGVTYRVYANFDDNTDIMQALYAETPDAIAITSTDGFYQDEFGGFTPAGINPGFFTAYPNLEYDSWLTIGQDNSNFPTNISIAAGPGWNSALASFETLPLGGDFEVNDGVGGSIYVTPGQVQGEPDEQGRILIAQLTTTGGWNMLCNIQWRDAELNVNQEVGLSIGYEVSEYTGLSYELIGEDTAPNGFDTYRVYANFDNLDAQVVAVFGLADTVLSIETSGSFFQDPLGGPTAGAINSGYFDSVDSDGNPFFPTLPYDSWVTIGADDNSGSVEVIGIDFTDFEAGGDLIIANSVGGTWYILPDQEPTAFPDVNGRVLIGQFTTDGIVDMTINIQYRSSGGENKQALAQSLTFPVVTPGCTDQGACNYDSLADFDDGSCDFTSCAGCGDENACNYNALAEIVDNDLCEFPPNYPNNTVDCDGNCFNDTDGDEVCDEDEIDGCTNPDATNYNSLATDDDGTCVILGCTDAAAENYNSSATEDDDSCQFIITGTQGCTYEEATNYDPEADLDDASCEFDCSGGGDCPFDADGNNLIGSSDLLQFLAQYGGSCPE